MVERLEECGVLGYEHVGLRVELFNYSTLNEVAVITDKRDGDVVISNGNNLPGGSTVSRSKYESTGS